MIYVTGPNSISTGKVVFRSSKFSEVVVFCPSCKALETLMFDRSGLMQTRRYKQEGDDVYHDCGSMQACRLFR